MFVFFFATPVILKASDSLEQFIIIQDIQLEGNKRTKASIINRELNIKKQDTIFIKDQKETFTYNRNRIFNTALFLEVTLSLSGEDSIYKTLLITVQERWYTYPIPVFSLADRNFNEWWQQRDRDIKRLELGILLIQKNVRGRNETLELKLTSGFNKKAEIEYTIPYIDKKQKTGLAFQTGYIANKQIAYKTSDHKLTFYDSDQYIRSKFSAGMMFSRRSKFYLTHFLSTAYFNNQIADTIATLNPNYFLNGKTNQQFFNIKYTIVLDRRDIFYYPLKGYYIKAEVEKDGLGLLTNEINIFSFKPTVAYYKPIYKKLYFATGFRGKISTPSLQPYFNQRGLGYREEVLSGYELSVIDGQTFGLQKVNLKWQLFKAKAESKFIPGAQFRSIPLAAYLKVYSDAGYVSDQTFNPENTRLPNKFLWSWGAGVDIVSYYDLVFRIEYSMNIEKQQGFYFNVKAGI